MGNGEIYASAPLRLVSLEIRFPLTSRILTRPVWDALENALASRFPEVTVLADAPDATVPRDAHQAVLRRTTLDHRRAVTLYTGAVTIELADYRCYSDLRSLTEETVRALETPILTQTTRLGLRYINEIRSDLVHEADENWQQTGAWKPYLNEQLLGGVKDGPAPLCAYANHGITFFHSPRGTEQVALDYGIQSEGVVEPDDVLLLGDPSGPCYVLDIDAIHYKPRTDEPRSGQDLLSTLDELHDFVELVFDWSVTERAKEVFRGTDIERCTEPLSAASNA